MSTEVLNQSASPTPETLPPLENGDRPQAGSLVEDTRLPFQAQIACDRFGLNGALT